MSSIEKSHNWKQTISKKGGTVTEQILQLFLPPPTDALPHLFFPIATNTMGKELSTLCYRS